MRETAVGRLPRASSPGTLKGEMLYGPLGRTGEHVSAIGLGGSHIGKPGIVHAAVKRRGSSRVITIVCS